MRLTLARGGRDRLAECAAVFAGSEIHARYFAGEDRLQRALCTAVRRGELWLALTDAGEVAGVMRVVPGGFCGLCPYLALLGTKPGLRGQGVGHFLMARLEQMALDAGQRRVCLMVSDFNTKGRAFYESLGYWTLGLLPDAAKPGIGEYVMLKDLTQASG